LEGRLQDARASSASEGDSDDIEQGSVGLKLRSGRGGNNSALLAMLDDDNDIKTRTVRKAVKALDSFGSYTAQTLRQNSTMRLSFALYFLLLHLWVIFVFYHFMTHASDMTVVSAGAPGTVVRTNPGAPTSSSSLPG